MDPSALRLRDLQAAFLFFRVTMGINIFLHGFTRIITGVDKFADTVAASFTSTPMPHSLTWAFLVVLPFLEAIIGAAQILGFCTRWAILAGAWLMTLLVLGTALRSDWASLGLQMTYVLCYFVLICTLRYDNFGFDHWFKYPWRSNNSAHQGE